MVDFRKPSTQEMIAAHRDYYARTPAEQKPAPPPRNVRHLIDIGNTRVFLYRGQPIRVPPTPVFEGLRIWELTALIENETDAHARSNHFRELIRVCTKCCRPVGRWRRLLRRVGLWKPFRDISQTELGGVASFLQQCQTSASILALSEREEVRLARWT